MSPKYLSARPVKPGNRADKKICLAVPLILRPAYFGCAVRQADR